MRLNHCQALRLFSLIYRYGDGRLMVVKPTNYKILSDSDISEDQIYSTIQTYDRFANKYAKKWEWNPETIKEIKKYNIKPFLQFTKKEGTVLIVGCQTGRDYSIFKEEGYKCIGTEFSFGLLSEAILRIPDGVFIRLFPKSLPFMPESFDAIYADALTIVPKKDIKDVLRDFKIFLRKNGVLYLSVKLGRKNILVLNDLGGPRYFTLFKKKEILDIVKKVGFKTLWSEESPNTDPVLPRWFSLIAKKVNE